MATPTALRFRRATAAMLGRATGDHALSQVVVIPVVVFLYSNVFVGGILSRTRDPFEPIAVVTIASILAWTFFSVAGVIINALFRRPSAWRAGFVLLVYAATEVLRISAVYELSSDGSIENDYGGLFRITGAASTGIVLFGLASVAVGDFRQYREGYLAHAQRLRGLTVVLEETQSSVHLVRTQLAVSIRRLLTQNVSDAFTLGRGSKRPPEEIANDLFRISDELVRPLSHGLSHDAPLPLPFDVPREAPRVPVRVFLGDVSTASPFQPGPLVAIFGLITAPTLILFTSARGFALWLLFLLMVGASAYFGKKVIAPHLFRVPVVVRLLIITPLFSAPSVFFMVALVMPGVAGASSIGELIAYGAVLGALLGWLPATAEGLQHSRQRFVTELETMDERLAWFQVRAQSQLWLDQKRLALALHSDVQGAILAAAMQLKNAVAEGPDVAQRVIPAVQKAITSSLKLEHEGSRAVTLASMATKVNTTWSTLISLTLEAPRDVTQALERDPLALEVVAEIIKELHLNSFKHGRATECVVTLGWGESGTVVLTMRNNGFPLSSRISPETGLGDTFLDSVSLSSSTADSAEGVVVRLVIPVALR